MRNQEQEIDLSLLEEMSIEDMIDYLSDKYGDDIAKEVSDHVNKIIEKEKK